MNYERLQSIILKIYRKELNQEEKYDGQFEKLMEKYADIIYGKIVRITKGKDITNVDLYGANKMLLSFSNAFDSVLKDFYKELNISGKLYQAIAAVNMEFNKELNANLTTDKKELDKQINQKNPSDGLTLNQRLMKSREELYNKLMKTVTINVAQKKGFYKIAEDIEQDIRSLFWANGRVMATEMNRMVNEDLVNIYKEMGIKEVIFSAILDSRTSWLCSLHHNKTYLISELITGINKPPLHPHCRSILLPFA